MDVADTLEALDTRIAEVDAQWPGPSGRLRAAIEIGSLVQQLRQSLGWTEHMLASRADVDMGLVIRLEAGRKLPRPSRLKVIADALRAAHGEA